MLFKTYDFCFLIIEMKKCFYVSLTTPCQHTIEWWVTIFPVVFQIQWDVSNMIPCNLQAVVILDTAVQYVYGHVNSTPIPQNKMRKYKITHYKNYTYFTIFRPMLLVDSRIYKSMS